MFILKAAIEKAAPLKADEVVPVLENIEYVGVMGVNKADSKTHNSIFGRGYLKNIGIQWIEGGKQEVVYPDDLESKDIVLPPALLKLKK